MHNDMRKLDYLGWKLKSERYFGALYRKKSWLAILLFYFTKHFRVNQQAT